jgi:hypothetical protein
MLSLAWKGLNHSPALTPGFDIVILGFIKENFAVSAILNPILLCNRAKRGYACAVRLDPAWG